MPFPVTGVVTKAQNLKQAAQGASDDLSVLWHPPRKCPTFGKTCTSCGRKNHFRIMCEKFKKGMNSVEVMPDTENFKDVKDDKLFFNVVSFNDIRNVPDNWTCLVPIGGSIIPFKFDTGAQENLITESDFNSL